MDARLRAEGLIGGVLWCRRRRFWRGDPCPWWRNNTGTQDGPRMGKAREVCCSIREEWKFAVTTVSTSWQGLSETCQQRESTYGTSFTPFQSGEKSGRRGGMLTVNIQDKGGDEFFKSTRAKGNASVSGEAKGRALLVSPAGGLTVLCSVLPLSAHRCPTRPSTGGTARAIPALSSLIFLPEGFTAAFSDLPHPPPYLPGPPLPSLGWPRNSFKAVLNMHCYTPPHFQPLKPSWNSQPRWDWKGRSGKCDACMGLRAVLQRRRCGNSGLQTEQMWESLRLVLVLTVRVSLSPGSTAFLPMLHSQEWGPSWCAWIFCDLDDHDFITNNIIEMG